MNSPTTLTAETFDGFIRSHRFVMIHFWAGWNGHDHMISSLLASEIHDKWSGKVAFATFDIDPPEHHPLCRDLRVLNVPFFAFYRDGKLVRKETGGRTSDQFSLHLEELSNADPPQ